METKINRASSVLMLYSLLLVIASLFSIPFPFVRQLWIREIWGITGLIHALIFFIIKLRIERASLSAVVACFGLILNEQILAVRTFSYQFSHEAVNFKEMLFLLGSIVFCLFLVSILFGAYQEIYKFRAEHKSHQSAKAAGIESYDESDFGILVVVAEGYALTFGLVFVMLPAPQYAVFKILASLASVFACGGIGQEINLYSQAKQTRFLCIVKSLSHALLLITILWIIYQKIPISSAII